ncbi:helix-turn-helix transcriptional regulator [Spongiactinospora sp. TRM90649]|uniref:helix-turn-helix domain-containing protein n=1 Tax=Spongiactinospora sp. TRM90649 TaxID=3031114 RepID=UPI0023F6D6EB|nr:helix-turn-helix transcriptional regulator [Spongiactinospora sp. TRM90649]MDF5755783.1 helix-turn-helix transcriptional regulator [Spongiactinospora sp. TRM90649]
MTSHLASAATLTDLALASIVLRMVRSQGTPEPALQLGALLDHVLDKSGLTQAALAAVVGVSEAQISRWKSGRSQPKFSSLVTLGTALRDRFPVLGVGPEELVAAAGYETTTPKSQPPLQAAPSGSEENDAEFDLATFVPTTPVEKALFAIYQANEQRMETLIADQQRQFRELSSKLDRLAGRQPEDDDDANGGMSAGKSA